MYFLVEVCSGVVGVRSEGISRFSVGGALYGGDLALYLKTSIRSVFSRERRLGFLWAFVDKVEAYNKPLLILFWPFID